MILIATGCVKIETGQTVGEAVESNEVRAKNMRVQWAEQLNNTADHAEKAMLVKNHIDSISALIIRYGFKVADEWHKGNEGRGKLIDASEMRQVVNSWVATQKPFLIAHEDNMEYGIRLVNETQKYNQFPDEAYLLFDSLANHYYDTYSVVFYPNQSVEFYEEALLARESGYKDLTHRLENLIR